MITDQLKDTLIDEIIKGLIDQGNGGLKPVLELLFNTAMKVEREKALVWKLNKNCLVRYSRQNCIFEKIVIEPPH